MKTSNQEILLVPLTSVYPDEHQPRKLFEPQKLSTLRESVKKFGIKIPLIVEKVGDKFLLEDGERRFRVAKDLGLDEVPVIVSSTKSGADRLIEQFHIQEQHEGWTSAEKASAVGRLSAELGLNVRQICDMLGVDDKTARMYIAYDTLANKKEYERNDIGIAWAYPILTLRNFAKKISLDKLDDEFTLSDEKDFELAVISRIRAGQLKRHNQLSQLRDAFTKDPKTIRKLIDTKATAEALFVESKAKGAYHIRNVINLSSYLASHIHRFMEIRDVKIDDDTLSKLKYAQKSIKEMIDMVG